MAKEKQDPVFSKEQKQICVKKIIAYLEEHFEVACGQLGAELFLRFLTEEIGPIYYNKGIEHSILFMTDRANDLYALMKDED